MQKNRWRSRKRLNIPWWGVVLMLIVLSVLFSFTSLAIQPGSVWDSLRSFWADKALFLLNGFPVVILILLLWAATANPLYAAAITGSIVNVFSYINLIKTECRGDPFVPDDIFLIREATTAAGEYDLNMHWGILALILALSAALVIGGMFTRYKSPKWYFRVACGLAVVAAFLGSMATVYPSADIYARRADSMDKSNVPLVYQNCGFTYCFLHNYNLYSISKPDGYSASEVAAWAQSSGEYTQPDVQPNVIFVMCEAFSDISLDDVFAYTAENDPLAGYKTVLQSDRAVSGHIVVSNFGAGTANTEFDVLTGIQTTMLGSASAFRVIHRSINALPNIYRLAGYHTYFMHPGQSWFYNRDSVYGFLGIDDRIFNEVFGENDWKGSMISDEAFLKQLIADLELRLTAEEPLFAYTVTIQNHQAYTYAKYDFTPDTVPLNTTISDAAMEALSVYMEGIRDSSQMLLELTQYLDTLDEPTVLVFFGDHLPTLLQDYGVYRELGMSIGGTDTPEDVLSAYETPFVIWANEAYAAQCDFAALELPQTISSNYLGAVLYELTGLEGLDPYFDELMQTRRELPVSNHDCYVLPGGSITTMLTAEQQELLTRLDQWKYYRLKDEALIELP